MRTEQANRVVVFFKSNDAKFMNACLSANIKATKHQASKWLNHKGIAYKMAKEAGKVNG
jgi:hypothetical protein